MKVSILVPVYNVSDYLRQCLDSIIAQTYKDLQVVIVDDGSTDNSLIIAEEYADKYTSVEVYHQENSGVAVARNNLLSHIKGDYVLFVDSDDWIEADMVEFLVTKVQECNADVVTCGMVVNDAPETGEYAQKIWNKKTVIEKFLLHNELSGSLCNKLTKVSLFHNIKFQTNISYGEDALFCWEVFQRIDTLVWTDKRLYHYRKNMNSISRQSWTPDRKGTGHIVWQTICDDVSREWPQFSGIAHARFALEDMWALYFASLCGYKYDRHIKERQDNIKKNLANIRRYKLDTFDRYVIAWVLGHWYGAGVVLKWIKR